MSFFFLQNKCLSKTIKMCILETRRGPWFKRKLIKVEFPRRRCTVRHLMYFYCREDATAMDVLGAPKNNIGAMQVKIIERYTRNIQLNSISHATAGRLWASPRGTARQYPSLSLAHSYILFCLLLILIAFNAPSWNMPRISKKKVYFFIFKTKF